MTKETQLQSEITKEFVETLPRSRRVQFLRTLLLAMVVLALGVLATVLWPKVVFKPHQDATSNAAKTQPTVVISVDSQGFMPAAVQVPVGTTVEWSNNGVTTHQVAADPYPSKSSLPSLDSGPMASSKTYKYQFNKPGTYTYHDQLNPLLSGTIIVH